MKHLRSVYIPTALVLLTIVMLVYFPISVEYMQSIVSDMSYQSYVYFVLLLVLATVVMPLTVMPLIPVAAAVLGPFATGVLSVIGWTLGGAIAFLLSRHLGRPVLSRYINFSRIDEFTANMPVKTRFFTIVLLRLTLPVDIASYALGLTKSVTLLEYTLATIIGVTWFSFAFAYMGDALLKGNVPILIEIAGVSLLIFTVGWYMLRTRK